MGIPGGHGICGYASWADRRGHCWSVCRCGTSTTRIRINEVKDRRNPLRFARRCSMLRARTRLPATPAGLIGRFPCSPCNLPKVLPYVGSCSMGSMVRRLQIPALGQLWCGQGTAGLSLMSGRNSSCAHRKQAICWAISLEPTYVVELEEGFEVAWEGNVPIIGAGR